MNAISSDFGRLQWVDAMRGFSMIVVVLGHVLLFMGLGEHNTFLSVIFLTFRMPLFFMVSGFFSFRALSFWNGAKVADILKRKFQAQVICTFVFLFTYQYATHHYLELDGFGGYWFTIVLFQMYLIYLCATLISCLCRRNLVLPIMIVLSIAAWIVRSRVMQHGVIYNLLCWENLLCFLQFFTLGLICARYKEQFFRVLENNRLITIAIIGWVLCMLMWYNNYLHVKIRHIYDFMHDIIVRYFALATVIMVFFSYRRFFEQDTRLSRLLRFIGRRTLDIYMLHYFFLPDLNLLKPLIGGERMIVIQLIVSGTLTVIIVALCLAVSAILRRSTTLECWLFGTRKRPDYRADERKLVAP